MAESSYTGIETVVTHECNDGVKGFWGELTLPRVDEDDPRFDLVQKLNEMMQQIEDRFNLLNKSEPIVACVINGAVVLNCADGDNFEIDMTTDINSITFKNCDNPGQNIRTLFRNIGTQDFNLSGWPANIVCTGCGSAVNPTVIEPGVNLQRNFNNNKNGVPIEASITGGEGGHPGGGGGGLGQICACVPDDPNLTSLTVKVCTSLDCNDATPKVVLTACGGTPPYTWSTTAGTKVESGVFDNSITVTPPTNTGPTVSGLAYKLWTCVDNCADVTPNCIIAVANYGCDDSKGSFDANCRSSGTFCPDCENNATCGGGPTCGSGLCDGCQGVDTLVQGCGAQCDERTAGMISAGCNPCGASMDGAVITVTDDAGVSVATVITVVNSA